MKSRNLKLLICLMTFLSLNNIVTAQTIPPANTEAGVINTEINVNTNNKLPKQKIKEEEKETKEEADFKVKVDETKGLPATIEKSGFILNTFEYEGNTVFSDEELNALASEYLGNFTSLDDLKVIMNNITNHYNNEGYITTFAYLPAQKIQNGTLKISIMEGKVSQLTIKGNKWAKERYLRKNILKANGLQEGQIFNVSSLRKSLGKINETDYLKGRVILNKGEDLESAEITLEVEDRFPLMLKAGWNNQGREFIGTQRAVLSVGNENITGYGDRLYANTTFARETFGLGTDYFVPLGTKGTELRIGYGYTDVGVGKIYKSLGFKSKAHGLSTGITHSIYEGKTTKLTTDLTFDMLAAKTFMNKSDLYDKYNLRALRLGFNGIKDDSSGRWISRFEVSTGLPFLGATTHEIKGGGSSKFVRFNPSLIRVHALPFKTTGILKVAAQFSPDNLLGVEQFQVGGMNSVRGYEEGSLFADTGYFLNLEVRKPIPNLPDYKYLRLKDKVQLAAFYDHGLGAVEGGHFTSNNFLQSLGFGFRIHLTDYLNANLDFGFPLGGSKTPARKDNMRFHFNLTSDVI